MGDIQVLAGVKIPPAGDRRPAPQSGRYAAAIRENGGSITPAKAAMETSLTIREVDWMLSEVASEGQLLVEGQDGSLFHALPRRSNLQLEDR